MKARKANIQFWLHKRFEKSKLGLLHKCFEKSKLRLDTQIQEFNIEGLLNITIYWLISLDFVANSGQRSEY